MVQLVLFAVAERLVDGTARRYQHLAFVHRFGAAFEMVEQVVGGTVATAQALEVELGFLDRTCSCYCKKIFPLEGCLLFCPS